MGSVLVTTSVENLQNGINSVIKTFGDVFVIYVSLNKTHKNVEIALSKANIATKKIFFIDCISSNEEKIEDVIYLKPTELQKIIFTIKIFANEIKQKKYILIDSLATLLIYNDVNKVARFVKNLTEIASQRNIEIVALSQKTTAENLLEKIFNFFDKVEKK